MRLLTSKDWNLISFFHKKDGRRDKFIGSSLNQILTDNHEQIDKNGKIKAQLVLEHVFGFCKTIEKIIEKVMFSFKS